MKRFVAVLLLLTGSLIGSCQCSEKPPVPPIDEGRQAAVLHPTSHART